MNKLAIASICALALACGGGGSSDGAPDLDAQAGDASTSGRDGGAHTDAAVQPIEGLDPSFGHGGRTVIEGTFTGTIPLWRPAIQPDGKIVAFGRTFESLVVVRALASGELDTGFGDGGVKVVPLGAPGISTPFHSGSVEVGQDGELVAAGYVPLYDGSPRGVVMRLDADGRVAPGFGEEGMVVLDSPTTFGSTFVDDVALQPDGKILTAGRGDRHLQVRRLLEDGAPDESFGELGVSRTLLDGQTAQASDVDILPDGSVVVAGDRRDSTGRRVALARLDASGQLDPEFGDGAGFVVDEALPDGHAVAYDVDARADGRLVVAATHKNEDFAIGRFMADGSVDPAFADAGWFLGEAPLLGLAAFGVAVQGEDKVVAVEARGRVARLLGDGSLDPSFGGNGVADGAGALGVALRSDDSVVTTGGGIRLFDATGSAAGDAASIDHPDVDRAQTLAAMPDGEVLVASAGYAMEEGGGIGFVNGAVVESAVVRLFPDGGIDSSFGVQGRVDLGDTHVHSLIPQPDGSALVGVAEPLGDGPQVLRLNAAGEVVEEVSTDGVPDGGPNASTAAIPLAMSPAADGGMFLMGADSAQSRAWVLRFGPDGDLDETFGEGGAATFHTEVLPAPVSKKGVVREQDDGSIVVAFDFKLARFTPAGEPDVDFGREGVVTLPQHVEGTASSLIVEGLELQGDGAVLVLSVGRNTPPGQGAPIRLARYRAGGELDESFGEGGVIEENLGDVWHSHTHLFLGSMGMKVAADGAILLAAALGEDGLTETAALLRYTADGSPDVGFGAEGRLSIPLSDASSSLHSITLDSQGRVLAGGRAWTAGGGSEAVVLRLD